MQLRKYLADPDITAEIARAMALAYDQVRAALPAMAIEPPLEEIAGRIAEEARKGTHDAVSLAQLVLSSLAHEEEASASISRNQIEGHDAEKSNCVPSPGGKGATDDRGCEPIEGTASARELSDFAAGRED